MTQFEFERRVEFCETDAAGIVHFSSLLQYVEQAEHALLRSVGFTVHSGKEGDVSWPRVHVEMDFMGPARFEDVLTIAVEVLEIGESSIRYGFHLRSTMGPIAKAQTVAVCCQKIRDSSGMVRISKVQIPESIRQALVTFQKPEVR